MLYLYIVYLEVEIAMFAIVIPLILGCPEPVDFSDRSVDNSATEASQAEAEVPWP